MNMKMGRWPFYWHRGLIGLSHFWWIREASWIAQLLRQERTSMPVLVFVSHNNYNGEYLACGTETCLSLPVIEWKFPAAFFHSPDDTRWNYRQQRLLRKKRARGSAQICKQGVIQLPGKIHNSEQLLSCRVSNSIFHHSKRQGHSFNSITTTFFATIFVFSFIC